MKMIKVPLLQENRKILPSALALDSKFGRPSRDITDLLKFRMLKIFSTVGQKDTLGSQPVRFGYKEY